MKGSDKMKEDAIEVGDTVSITFNNAQFTLCSFATVLSMPCATGDSWVFKSFTDSPEIYYVSEGCTIKLLGKGPKP